MGLAEQGVRTVTRTAVEDSTLLVLSRESFKKLQIEQPVLAITLLKHLLLKSFKGLKNTLKGFPGSSATSHIYPLPR
jgi:CRP-like cAMP-binding protein